MENKIKKLLEKYFEAQTSLEEEKVLMDYFHKHDIPDEFLPYKAMFETFSKQGQEMFSGGAIVNNARIQRNGKERKILGMYPESFRFVSRIAAGLIFLVSIYIGFNSDLLDKHVQVEDTFSDPYVAYQVTLKAINQVTQYMDKGMQHTAGLAVFNNGLEKAEPLEKVNDIFNKAGNELKSVQDGVAEAERISIWSEVNRQLFRN